MKRSGKVKWECDGHDEEEKERESNRDGGRKEGEKRRMTVYVGRQVDGGREKWR